MTGTAILSFEIDTDGSTLAVEVTSGHPLFAASARQNLSTWRFVTDPQGSSLGRQRVTFVFDLSNRFEDGFYDPSKEQAEFDGVRSVRVVAAPNPRSFAEDCPTGLTRTPDASIGVEDFVSLSRSGCYGRCPVYAMKVYGDGRVLWKGTKFVRKVGDFSFRIPAADAQLLMERFRNAEVWRLCGDYRKTMTDMESVLFEVSIGGENKRVSDYAYTSPEWFQVLRTEVDRVADTRSLRFRRPPALR